MAQLVLTMPRPQRSQGRPGTRVIPKDWETSHAVVAAKSMTATIKFYPPITDGSTPVMNDDFTYQPGPEIQPVYDGAARIQVLNGQETQTLVADQDSVTTGYLVVIDRDADGIPLGAIGVIQTVSDPTLIGTRTLIVRKIARGSLRFERDLWCTDDLTAPTS